MKTRFAWVGTGWVWIWETTVFMILTYNDLTAMGKDIGHFAALSSSITPGTFDFFPFVDIFIGVPSAILFSAGSGSRCS